MSGSGTIDRAAFDNHLYFIAAHRGDLTRDEDGIRIESPAAGFTSWTPLRDGAAVPRDCAAVRLGPASAPDWPDRLRAECFEPAESLVYMALSAGEMRPAEGSVPVERAECAKGAQLFADVQSAGFATGNPEVDDWWRRFFADKAEQNIGDPNQSFYLAGADGAAGACALVVDAGGVAGLYAVATRPEHRRHGLATALLGRAAEDARSAGLDTVILQAMKGSYAEGYYSRLGFRELCTLTMWRRP